LFDIAPSITRPSNNQKEKSKAQSSHEISQDNRSESSNTAENFNQLEERLEARMEQQAERMEQQAERIEQQAEQFQQQLQEQFQQLLSRLPTPDPPAITPPPTQLPAAPPAAPPATHTEPIRMPAVPQFDKLKGRQNFKTWALDVTHNAHTYGVWEALQNPSPALTYQLQSFALSLIISNVSNAIKHQLASATNAHDAWQALNKRYNTQNIAQVTQYVQELGNISINKFNSIETFQQRIATLQQFILAYTNSYEEAFHTIFAAFALNAVGKANGTVKAQIEGDINNKQFDPPDQIHTYIYDRLLSYKGLTQRANSSNINAINKQERKLCGYCEKIHFEPCFIQHPEKAPDEKKELYQHLYKIYQAKKASQPASQPQVSSIHYLDGSDSDIYLDSGTCNHVVNNRSLFRTFQPIHRQFSTANGSVLNAEGIRQIQINSPHAVTISNVYYCPQATRNLLSTEDLFARGMQLKYLDTKPHKHAAITLHTEHIFDVELCKGVLRIVTEQQTESVHAIATRRERKPTRKAQENQVYTHKAERQAEARPNPASTKPNSATQYQSTERAHTLDSEILDSIELNPAPLRRKQYEPSASQGEQLEAPIERIDSSPEPSPEREPEPERELEPEPEPERISKPANQQAGHKAPKANIYDWHERLGHLSRTQIRKLHAAKLIHILKQPGQQGACDICSQSKATRHTLKDHMPITTRPFERFHFDLIGGKRSLPFNKDRYKYILVATDDFSRYKWAWALSHKSQAVGKL
jgi:hypothetical protein